MVSMVSAQAAMVLVMAITPLHMHHHHHPMGTISAVITAHFLGMYGLSVLSGWLADRLGRMRAVGLGGVVLAVSCVLAPLSRTTPMLMAALFLLGLGWSFCFLGGSSALAEGLAEGERGRIQGFTEALVSLSSGVASLSSGLLFAAFGFTTMTLVGLGVSALPLVCFLASPARMRPAPAAGPA
jgi:MFS family permease